MLTIRLARFGRKKQPSYRLIISEKTKDTKGHYLEQLGFYNPRTQPKTIELKADRIKYWIGQGAQASDTVHNLLVKQGVIDEPKRRKGRIDKKKKKAESETTPTADAKPASAAEKDKEKKEERQTAGQKPETKAEGKATESKSTDKPVKDEKK